MRRAPSEQILDFLHGRLYAKKCHRKLGKWVVTNICCDLYLISDMTKSNGDISKYVGEL